MPVLAAPHGVPTIVQRVGSADKFPERLATDDSGGLVCLVQVSFRANISLRDMLVANIRRDGIVGATGPLHTIETVSSVLLSMM